MHVDMDYFFAACEELRHPELRGTPFIVGTYSADDRRRGVVQTASYAARKFGVKSGIPTAMAFRLCNELGYVAPDDPYYEEISKKVMSLLRSRGFPLEEMSIDEAALDIGEMGYQKAEELARSVKAEIKQKLRLPCSIGVGTGKAFAKMACDDAKPDGIKVVRKEELEAYIGSKDVGALPGVGKKTEERLKEMGISTITGLAKSNQMALIDAFGVLGRELYALAHGVDTSKVVEHYEALSVGRERTLANDATRVDEILDVLKGLTEEVMKDVHARGLLFRNIGVKAKYSDFTERIRSTTTNNYTDSADIVYSTAIQLLRGLMNGPKVRKIGVRVSRFVAEKGQKKLFSPSRT